jgi:hypothetical protein
MSAPANPLVQLRSALALEEAVTLKSALDAAGIEARLFDADTAATNWAYMFALGGVRVMVHESDYADAAAIADEGDRAEHAEKCAACGSKRLARKKSLIAAAAGFLLGGVPLVKRTRQTQCVDCRHFWDSE